jgi:transcriptional regulator with XRE-family HTH domain
MRDAPLGKRQKRVQMYRQAVAANVKRERENAGLTQTDLGKVIGKSREIVSRMETGDIKIPADFIPDIAAACGVSIRRLFQFDDNTTATQATG